MIIYFSKYKLEKKNSLNSKDVSGFQEGALIKVFDSSQNCWGVADLCPWPNLGDQTLEEELQTKGPLFQRSFELANQDLKARKEKKSLLFDKFVDNNLIITDFKKFDLTQNLAGVIKVKGSNQVDHLCEFLEKLCQQDIKVRLDFNSSLSAAEFNYFLDKMSPQVATKIEYIEDPTLWSSANWSAWNKKIPLGFDFNSGDPFKNEQAWSYLVIKPSRQSAKNLIHKCQQLNKKFTLTSAMDHPVGLAHGLRYAQKYAAGVSGFLTLDLYEKTDFNSYFKVESSRVGFSQAALDDYGIGMTTALNNLSWKVL